MELGYLGRVSISRSKDSVSELTELETIVEPLALLFLPLSLAPEGENFLRVAYE